MRRMNYEEVLRAEIYDQYNQERHLLERKMQAN